MIIEEKNNMEAAYKLDLQQVSNDFEDLKKHLVHITRYYTRVLPPQDNFTQKSIRTVNEIEMPNISKKFPFLLKPQISILRRFS